MTTRRSFLGSLLALAAAPAVAGFRPTATALSVSPGGYVSVRDFGAIGDGITDDSAALERALRAASKRGRAAVYVPHGRYVFSHAGI